MARSPDISESDYRTLVSIIEAEGYDVEKLRRVPHNNNDPV
jgi:lipocalin